MTTIEVLCLVVVLLVLIFTIAGSILLYNFMQLLSTMNKRLVATVGDILGNISLTTENINQVTDNVPTATAGYSQLLDDDDSIIGDGFNPHNYDPFINEDTE